MSEYVILAVKFGEDVTNPAEDIYRWHVGTRQSVQDRAQQWTEQGYDVAIRGCTHRLNNEFFMANLNYNGTSV